MAFQSPPRSTFTAAYGNEYSYIYTPPDPQKSTILFLHGFPSTSYDWIYQIQYFSSKGYGIVAPDLLGYGGSSKPSDVYEYRLKPMGDEIIELLDHLGVSKAVGIGHDFGSTLLSRTGAYHPTRWIALIFIAVGPPKPGTPFDVDIVNQITKESMGFEMLGYIPWLGGEPDAQNTLEKHPEAVMNLMFSASQSVWDEWFHPLGRMKQFVEEDRKVPIAEWYLEEMQQQHLQSFGKPDGYKGATRWYKMWMENLFAPNERGFKDFKIAQPSLFISGASESIQEQMLAEWVPNLTTVKIEAGHWIHLEQSQETNKAINRFLDLQV
ncbi:Fc.00g009790.m01.CDS01 [Cosmosporella sp. VM-42]